MSTSDILKKNLPEFQQGSPALDSYLDAAGEFLDGTKEAIVNLDFTKDYKKSTEYGLINTLGDRGFAVPSILKENIKRRLLRDVADIHRKNGTLDGLLHAIRLAGINPEVRVGWVGSPQEIRRGYIIDPETQESTRYDITRFIYTDLLYGEEVVTDDGVFFEGYVYEDPLKTNKLGPFPILGERYDNVPTASSYAVAKTPYLIVRFEEGGSTIVTDPVVDPDTGEVFAYSIGEQFQKVEEVLRYFLVESNRPTTIRIIVIVALQDIEEILTITDEHTDEHTYNPDGGDDLVDQRTVIDNMAGRGIVDATGLVIGSANIIGTPSPFRSRHSAIDINIGDIPDTLPERYEWSECVSRTFHDVGKNKFLIPLRGDTDIWFTTPNTDAVIVRGHRYLGDTTPVVLANVQPSTPFFMQTPVEYHLIELVYDGNGLNRTMEIGVHYKAQRQNQDAEYAPEILTEDGFVITTEDSFSLLVE